MSFKISPTRAELAETAHFSARHSSTLFLQTVWHIWDAFSDYLSTRWVGFWFRTKHMKRLQSYEPSTFLVTIGCLGLLHRFLITSCSLHCWSQFFWPSQLQPQTYLIQIILSPNMSDFLFESGVWEATHTHAPLLKVWTGGHLWQVRQTADLLPYHVPQQKHRWFFLGMFWIPYHLRSVKCLSLCHF